MTPITTQIQTIIADADYVLVGAGRGLSLAAGVDYDDPPTLAPLANQWPQLMAYLAQVRFAQATNTVYQQLLALLGSKPYFIITTNQDGWFSRSGVHHHQLYTAQGDYSRLQCHKNCQNRTFATLPYVKKSLAHPTEPPPVCPDCGATLNLNIAGNDPFCEQPYGDQASRYYRFINGSTNGRLAILELGVGYTTPQLIRFPFEHIISNHPNAQMIRINTQHPLAVEENAHKVLSIGEDISTILAKIT